MASSAYTWYSLNPLKGEQGGTKMPGQRICSVSILWNNNIEALFSSLKLQAATEAHKQLGLKIRRHISISKNILIHHYSKDYNSDSQFSQSRSLAIPCMGKTLFGGALFGCLGFFYHNCTLQILATAPSCSFWLPLATTTLSVYAVRVQSI